METSVALRVLDKAVAFGVKLPAVCKILVGTLREIILIYKVVSRIVGRVNVNHFDFAEIGLLQQLQHVKIIAFNIQILRGIKINALLPAGAKGLRNRRIRQQDRLLLVRPSELIPLLIALDDNRGQLLPQHIKVDSPHNHTIRILYLSQAVRKQRPDFRNIFVHLIRAVHFQFIHCGCPPKHLKMQHMYGLRSLEFSISHSFLLSWNTLLY